MRYLKAFVFLVAFASIFSVFSNFVPAFDFNGTVTDICPCEEDWSCGAWSECIEGIKTRTCTDQNNCGTIVGKPIESQGCELLTAIEPLTYAAGIGIIVFVMAIMILYFKVVKKE